MKSWCGLVGFFAVLGSHVVKAEDAAPAPAIPTKLKIYAGGYQSSLFWVEFQDPDTLVYRRSKWAQEVKAEDKIPVDAAKWTQFRAALDQAAVWDWQPRYDNGASDGAQWEVTVEYADRRISSTGSNDYPRKKSFDAVMAAVDALLGGNSVFAGEKAPKQEIHLQFDSIGTGRARWLVTGDTSTTRAPHDGGNVYAPEVMMRDSILLMWFGGQGRDGHDRIHLALSRNGLQWQRDGVVLEDATANHVNDPSVVEKDGTLYMFYTRAGSGVTDEIAMATSPDGEKWQKRGVVLSHGPDGSWDSLGVGRPAVLYADGLFRMWYDGRKDLPLGAPDDKAPKSADSHRFVGYATSPDGIHWERRTEPVLGYDAGGVQVSRFGDHLVMVIESREGTLASTSPDGIVWSKPALLVKRLEKQYLPEDFGHVTPFLLPDPDGKGATLFYGAASKKEWDGNAISMRRLDPKALETLGKLEAKK